jgi:hypothetical protein
MIEAGAAAFYLPIAGAARKRHGSATLKIKKKVVKNYS